MQILDDISQFLQKGRAPQVKELVTRALEENVPAQTILDGSLLSAMSIVGEKFKNNKVFVPEVLIAARAMNAGLEILKPYLIKAGEVERGTIVLGTVKGDLHDIGKNLVKIMMEGKGIKVVDLGVDVPAERFIEAAEETGAKLICCSALLTTTMGEMENIVALRKQSNLPTFVKVMVGGAPVTQDYCEKINADLYSPDAASAAEIALKYMQSA